MNSIFSKSFFLLSPADYCEAMRADAAMWAQGRNATNSLPWCETTHRYWLDEARDSHRRLCEALCRGKHWQR